MNNIFDKKYRKSYTKNKINNITNLLLKVFKTKKQAGWFVTIFMHYLPHFILFTLFLIHPFNISFFIILILAFAMHLFFNGCIHLRLERHLFENKKWTGPYHFLENLGIELNTKTINKFLYVGVTIILMIYLIKLYKFLKQNKFDLDEIKKNFLIPFSKKYKKNISLQNNIFYLNDKIFWTLIIWWSIQVSIFLAV